MGVLSSPNFTWYTRLLMPWKEDAHEVESQSLKIEMCLRCVIVNAINEAGNVATLIRTNDKAF